MIISGSLQRQQKSICWGGQSVSNENRQYLKEIDQIDIDADTAVKMMSDEDIRNLLISLQYAKAADLSAGCGLVRVGQQNINWELTESVNGDETRRTFINLYRRPAGEVRLRLRMHQH